MSRWDWLTTPAAPYTWRFVRNVLLKAIALFVALNLGYALLQPLPWLSRITFYNSILPGRERLPFAENPQDAYSVSLHRLEGMFAAHEISRSKRREDEFRVVVLGDSAVWGWLLEPGQTLSACLNAGDYRTPDGRRLRTYDLGYPVLDILKDTMILEEALKYEPDAVLWFITLASFYPDEQLSHPVVRNNADRARALIKRYDLALDAADLPDNPPLLERTIIGQRRELADLLRHQVYGIAWWATGVDHTNPKFFQKRLENLLPGDDIFGRQRVEGGWTEQNLSIDVLSAGLDLAARVNAPVLLINEPVFRSSGINSETRYNDYYPRWAFDSWRELMDTLAQRYGWNYLDLWDAAPNDQFTDTVFHLIPAATCEFAAQVAPHVLALAH
jgi:hypothetical protein